MPSQASTGFSAEIAAAEHTARRTVSEGVQAYVALEAKLVGAPLALRRDVLVRLRHLQRDLGDFEAARATNGRLRSLGQTTGDLASQGLADLGDIDNMLWSYQTDAGKQAKARFLQRYDLDKVPDLAYQAHNTFGSLASLESAYEVALGHFQSALQLADRQTEAVDARVETLGYLANLYGSMKEMDTSLRYVAQALAEDGDAVRPSVHIHLYLQRALALVSQGRLNEAELAYREGLRIARSADVRIMQAHMLANIADLALHRKQWTAAEAAAREALVLSERVGDLSAVVVAKANVGFALGGQGKVAAALPLLDEVIAHFRSNGNVQALGAMLDEKAAMYERLGMYKETLAALREHQAIERKQFSTERTNAVAALQEKFQQAENSRRIKHLQRENSLKDEVIRTREIKQAALGGVVVLALVVAGLVLVLYRRAGRSNDQLRSLNARLEYMAVRDPLTGLFNRRSFMERMRARTERGDAERRRGRAQGGDIFIVLDLDHFKRVNDTYGHHAGDQVLVEVARRLQLAVRDSDTVLRWGGEEFVVHSTGPADGAPALVTRILDGIRSQPIAAGSLQLPVTVSAGMIALPLAGMADMAEAAIGWERALQLADAALYQSKTKGRNRCHQVLGVRGASEAQLTQLFDAGALPAGQLELAVIAEGNGGPVS